MRSPPAPSWLARGARWCTASALVLGLLLAGAALVRDRPEVVAAEVEPAAATAAATATTTSSTTTTSAPATPRRAPGRDGDPQIDGDFADPFLLETDAGIVAYATNTEGMNVPVRTLVDGALVVDEALPTVASWSTEGAVWAPSVIEIDGVFVLYYTTRERSSGLQCISVATSTEATGPFVDRTTEPIVCDRGGGGSIDASPVVDENGARHLLWKTDGNCCGLPTVIWVQPLDADGQGVAGVPTELVRNDQAWEGDVVEAPSMARIDGVWVLLYSGNDWASADYAIGYAICETVTGPCEKPTSEPLLASDADRTGPGGAELVTTRGGVVVVFHAWSDGRVGYHVGGERQLLLGRLTMTDGSVVLT